jgi:hypothetical protein
VPMTDANQFGPNVASERRARAAGRSAVVNMS